MRRSCPLVPAYGISKSPGHIKIPNLNSKLREKICFKYSRFGEKQSNIQIIFGLNNCQIRIRIFEKKIRIRIRIIRSSLVSVWRCALSAMCRYLSWSAAGCQAGCWWLCSCPQSTWRHGQHHAMERQLLSTSTWSLLLNKWILYCLSFSDFADQIVTIVIE